MKHIKKFDVLSKINSWLKAKFLMIKTTHDDVLHDLRFAKNSLKGNFVATCNSSKYEKFCHQFSR